MKKVASTVILSVLFLIFAPTTHAQVRPDLQDRLSQGPLIVDKDSIPLIDEIPEFYLNRARNIHLLYSNRSVGGNIDAGLDCFDTQNMLNFHPSNNPGGIPNSCRITYINSDWETQNFNYDVNGDGIVTPEEVALIPEEIRIPWHQGDTFMRNNWTYEFRMGSWYQLTQDFVESLIPQYIQEKDVLSYQFSYLNVDGDSTNSNDVANPECGYFNTGDRSSCDAHLRDWHVGRIVQLEQQHPEKVFFYWTTSLARSIGTDSSTVFNEQMRQFAIQNNKILFDFADIISHDPEGQPCFDNRDGVEFCSPSTGECQTLPDDGYDYPAICQFYTTETDGGHLGSVSAGRIRAAKAYWVLMAQIAGWDPDDTSPPPTTIPYPTPSNTPTPQPSPTPGVSYSHLIQNFGSNDSDTDLNNDGIVNIFDLNLWISQN